MKNGKMLLNLNSSIVPSAANGFLLAAKYKPKNRAVEYNEICNGMYNVNHEGAFINAAITATSVSPKSTSPETGTAWRCKGCFGNDISALERNEDGRWVCGHCGVEDSPSTYSHAGAKACAVADDPTARGDAPCENVDPYTLKSWPTASEVRQQRENSSTTYIADVTKRKLGFLHADQNARRVAAREAQLNDIGPANERKLRSLMGSLQEAIDSLAPCDDEVQTRIRRFAGRVFNDAVAHDKVCTQFCQTRLLQKSTMLLAHACLSSKLDSMRSDHRVGAGEGLCAARHDLLALVERSQRLRFAGFESQQNAAVRAALAVVTKPGYNACLPCENEDSIRAKAEEAAKRAKGLRVAQYALSDATRALFSITEVDDELQEFSSDACSFKRIIEWSISSEMQSVSADVKALAVLVSCSRIKNIALSVANQHLARKVLRSHSIPDACLDAFAEDCEAIILSKVGVAELAGSCVGNIGGGMGEDSGELGGGGVVELDPLASELL